MSEEIVQEEGFEEVAEEVATEETQDEQGQEQPEEVDWEARAKKAEALIVKNKKEPKQKQSTNRPQESGDDVPEWGQRLLELDQKRTFQSDNNLTPDTVDAVFRANGGKMPTAEQMAEDELLKTVVRSYQAKSRVTANTPSGGSAPVYKGKSYGDIVTSPDSTPEDRQAAFEATKKKHGIK
jgi:hypothetical protein